MEGVWHACIHNCDLVIALLTATPLVHVHARVRMPGRHEGIFRGKCSRQTATSAILGEAKMADANIVPPKPKPRTRLRTTSAPDVDVQHLQTSPVYVAARSSERSFSERDNGGIQCCIRVRVHVCLQLLVHKAQLSRTTNSTRFMCVPYG